MSRLGTSGVAALLIFCATTGTAQDTKGGEDTKRSKEETLDIPVSSDPGKQPFLRNFAKEEWRMWSSPFRSSNYDSKAVKKYVIPFVIISASLIAADRKIADGLPNSQDQAKWSGRVSQLGSSYSMAGATAAMYLIGKATGNKHARETGFLAMDTIAHTQLIVFGIKQMTNRRRPVTDESPRNFWSGGDSFPSGHAATSFGVATIFAYEYRHHIAVPIAAYSIATAVSLSRMSARRHWASDVFVGGSTGFLIGRFIYKHHHNPLLPGSPVQRGFASRLIPEFGMSPWGPSLVWHL